MSLPLPHFTYFLRTLQVISYANKENNQLSNQIPKKTGSRYVFIYICIIYINNRYYVSLEPLHQTQKIKLFERHFIDQVLLSN